MWLLGGYFLLPGLYPAMKKASAEYHLEDHLIILICSSFFQRLYFFLEMCIFGLQMIVFSL